MGKPILRASLPIQSLPQNNLLNSATFVPYYAKESSARFFSYKKFERLFSVNALALKYVNRAGIRKRGACNLFRHSTATPIHENSADIRYVQEMLGHADNSTTHVYTHVTVNKLRDVYKKTHPAVG